MADNPDAKRQRQVDGEIDGNERTAGQASTSAPTSRVHDYMPAYYAKLFPHQLMYKWLAYGNDSKAPQADATFFHRREFCFTLDGDIFVRYQAFRDADEMAAAIRAKCPAKIDIGPVYSACPQERLKFGASFRPLERELVFDVDLTDYDDVRTCGSGGHICGRCWPLMAVAIKIVDAGLRQEFGFQHIVWVYSGRRGIHCWVCDPSARALSDEARSAVAGWFSVYRGHEEGRARVALASGEHVHPALERALGVLDKAWAEHILPAQRLFETPEGMASLLRFLPDDASGQALAATIRARWEAAGLTAAGAAAAASKKAGGAAGAGANAPGALSVARWRMFKEEVEGALYAARNPSKGGRDFKLCSALAKVCCEVQLAHAYPRLDVEVSRKMNHLLKAPFCVHPKTGRVCVPLEVGQVDAFDPDTVPSVQGLLEQMAAAEKQQPLVKGDEWRSTDMAGAVGVFERVLLAGMAASNREALASRARAGVVLGQMHLDY